METVIRIIWSVGIAGALVATLVILKEVSNILHVLKKIRSLARTTRVAAAGIRNGFSSLPLFDLREPIGRFARAAGLLVEPASLMEEKLRTLAASRGARGGP